MHNKYIYTCVTTKYTNTFVCNWCCVAQQRLQQRLRAYAYATMYEYK